jgi:hypothetical protein
MNLAKDTAPWISIASGVLWYAVTMALPTYFYVVHRHDLPSILPGIFVWMPGLVGVAIIAIFMKSPTPRSACLFVTTNVLLVVIEVCFLEWLCNAIAST